MSTGYAETPIVWADSNNGLVSGRMVEFGHGEGESHGSETQGKKMECNGLEFTHGVAMVREVFGQACEIK